MSDMHHSMHIERFCKEHSLHGPVIRDGAGRDHTADENDACVC